MIVKSPLLGPLEADEAGVMLGMEGAIESGEVDVHPKVGHSERKMQGEVLMISYDSDVIRLKLKAVYGSGELGDAESAIIFKLREIMSAVKIENKPLPTKRKEKGPMTRCLRGCSSDRRWLKYGWPGTSQKGNHKRRQTTLLCPRR